MSSAEMRDFWDQRAREDAPFFVDDRRRYGDPDLGGFWGDGEQDLDRLLNAVGVGVEPGDTVLDLGCGIGRLTRVLAARARQVYALDVSPEMIERARREHAELRNVEWIVGDGTTLRPVGDAGVDLCVSHVVFQHIPDPEVTLGYVSEMARVLKPGGRAAFGFSNNDTVHLKRSGPAAAIRRLRARLGGAPQGLDQAPWLGAAVSLERIREVAAASGLSVERVAGEGMQLCVVGARRLPPQR